MYFLFCLFTLIFAFAKIQINGCSKAQINMCKSQTIILSQHLSYLRSKEEQELSRTLRVPQPQGMSENM